jgi:hypothetical protein
MNEWAPTDVKHFNFITSTDDTQTQGDSYESRMKITLIHGNQMIRESLLVHSEHSQFQPSIILTSIKSKIRKTVEALGKLVSDVKEQQKLKAQDHCLAFIRASIICVLASHTSDGFLCKHIHF